MTQKFINNFRTTVASTFGAADTILNLTSAAGLPTLTGGDFFTLTLFRQSGVEESGHEVVKVTARTGTACTVERSYEGAPASQFLAGSIVSARVSAKAMELKADTADLSAAVSSINAAKQNNLVSGTNIKTVAGVSIVGSGDASIDYNALTNKPWVVNATINYRCKIPGTGGAVSVRDSTDSDDIFRVHDTDGVSVMNNISIDAYGQDATMAINATVGDYSSVSFRAGGVDRWFFGRTNTAESGGNAGSNFFIGSFDDVGSFLDTCMSIERATGNVTFNNRVTVGDSLNEAKGNDIPSAATLNLSTATGNLVHITGTTGITTITIPVGAERTLVFDGVVTLTHSLFLDLPGKTNITTDAGSIAVVRGDAGGIARVVSYRRSDTTIVETVNTTTPNATVPVVARVAKGTPTNIDVAYSPKGTGALLAHVPDNATTGGNKRGTNAVDLQTSRTSSTHVASGAGSVISGGRNNRTVPTDSVISGGNGNYISSGLYGSIGGGLSNSVSGPYSRVGGGVNNSVLNTASVIAGGDGNGLSGDYSSCPGGTGANDHTIRGAYVWAGAAGGAVGIQKGEYLLGAITTTNSSTVLTADGAAVDGVTVLNEIVMPDNSSFYCTFKITGRNAANGATASWTGTALFTRGAGAGTCTRVGGTVTASFVTGGFSPSAPTITADTTLGAIKVTVLGLSATTIKWACLLEAVESYA